jgi:opacity protein-like surface antigen
MRPIFRVTLLAAAAALALPAAARAGDPPVGLHAFAAIDFNSFNASHTFNAIFGSTQLAGYGGGADVTGLWKHLFVRFAITSVSKTGTRVFVDNSQVFKLNEPAKLSLTPIELGAGWRFESAHSKLTPYIGGGGLFMSYKVDYPQSSDLNESESFTGGLVFGGVDFAITKVLTVGGEAQYRTVPNALTSDLASSVANAFNETNLGGFTGRVTFGVKFGK